MKYLPEGNNQLLYCGAPRPPLFTAGSKVSTNLPSKVMKPPFSFPQEPEFRPMITLTRPSTEDLQRSHYNISQTKYIYFEAISFNQEKEN